MSSSRPRPAPYHRGNPREKVSVKMTPALKKLVTRRAREQGMSRSAWLEEAAKRQLIAEEEREEAMTS